MLLVDDHAIVREGLKRVLCPKGSNWALTEAETGFQALELLQRKAFDLALVDLSLPGMNGLELIRRIKTEFAAVRVLVLSMHAEEQYALRAFKAGANGYVTKDMAAKELVGAVRRVVAGGAYVTASLAESVVRQLNGSAKAPRHALSTDREFDVLRRIAAGITSHSMWMPESSRSKPLSTRLRSPAEAGVGRHDKLPPKFLMPLDTRHGVRLLHPTGAWRSPSP